MLRELELRSLAERDSFCSTKGEKAVFLVGRVRKQGKKILTLLTVIHFIFKPHLKWKFCIRVDSGIVFILPIICCMNSFQITYWYLPSLGVMEYLSTFICVSFHFFRVPAGKQLSVSTENKTYLSMEKHST